MSRGSGVFFPITSDATQLLAATGAGRTGADELGKALGEAAEKGVNLDRVANQIRRSVETLPEKVSRLKEEAKLAFNADKIGMPEYLRRIGDLDKQLGEYKSSLDDTIDVSDQALGLSAANRVTDLQSRVTEFGKDIGNLAQPLKRIDTAQEATFGRAAKARLAALGIALSEVVEVMREARELANESAQRAIGAAEATGALAQLAGGDEQELGRLIAARNATFAEGAVADLGESARLTFELSSAKALAERAFFSLLNEIDDAAQIARSANVVRTNLGERETGNLENIADKLIAAALPATGVNASDIGLAAGRAAQAGKRLGLSDEEIIAAVGRLAEATGDAPQAGTQLNSLFRALIRRGFADENFGAPLAETLRGINDLGKTNKELITFFGRAEAATAFGALSDVDVFESRLRDVDRAQRDDLARASVEAALARDEISVRRLRQAAANQKELSRQADAFEEARIQATLDRSAVGSSPLGEAIFRRVVEKGVSIAGIPLVPSLRDIPGFDALLASQTDRSDEILDMNEVAAQLDAFNRNLEEQKKVNMDQLEEQKRTNRKLDDSPGLIAGPG